MVLVSSPPHLLVVFHPPWSLQALALVVARHANTDNHLQTHTVPIGKDTQPHATAFVKEHSMLENKELSKLKHCTYFCKPLAGILFEVNCACSPLALHLLPLEKSVLPERTK